MKPWNSHTHPSLVASNPRIGDTVTSVCGPGQSSHPKYATRIGLVYGYQRSERWGDCIRVKWDDFTFTSVPYFVTIGIGVYHFPKR